jgi:bifunctional UDP-N-acetylglucosamine pyrophosphorylase/glucosamine-1-phosphate N-acetyltransferase
MSQLASRIVLVVGAFEESVRESLRDYPDVEYVRQAEQLGTGHAAQIGFSALSDEPPELILVGYGDHLMFYQPERIQDMIDRHRAQKAVISFATTIHENPDELAWGRIERDGDGEVQDIVEQKDASETQRAITELNAGLYCFSFDFLREYISQIQQSPITGEYYLTDLIKIACLHGLRVLAVPFPFQEVGIGINSPKELSDSQQLYQESHE